MAACSSGCSSGSTRGATTPSRSSPSSLRVNSVNPAFAGVRPRGRDRRRDPGERDPARALRAGRARDALGRPGPRAAGTSSASAAGRAAGARSPSTGTSTRCRPVEPESWVNGSPWNPEIRDGRLYGIGSTDMKGSDTAMWLVAQALEDEGVELEGDLLLHSVVGEETMQHELGTSAVIEAGFGADAADRHRADVDPEAAHRLADRRGQLVLPDPRRGQEHPLREPGARDPARRTRATRSASTRSRRRSRSSPASRTSSSSGG